MVIKSIAILIAENKCKYTMVLEKVGVCFTCKTGAPTTWAIGWRHGLAFRGFRVQVNMLATIIWNRIYFPSLEDRLDWH